MPELPEVETVRRELAPALLRRTIRSVEVRLPKMLQTTTARLRRSVRGRRVVSVRRRAKLLLIGLSGGWTIVIHLKMSGQLIWQPERGVWRGGGHPIPGGLSALPNAYSHVIFHLNGGTLYFNDLRQFGFVKVLKTAAIGDWFMGQGIGPEPLSPELTFTVFNRRLQHRARSLVKGVLLDQRFLAGLGNIYADESLFAAQVRPTRRVVTLSDRERRRLFAAIRAVLRLALRHNGTTFRFFRRPGGETGDMTRHLRVYGRSGERCRRCGSTIVKIRLQQRGTHYCLRCQH